MPLAVETSIFPHIASYSSPTDYTTDLSNQYACANLWGKSEIHLHLLDQERRRLDTLNFQIHSHIARVCEEADMVRAQISEMKQKHEVLQDLYRKHAAEIKKLEQVHLSLQ